MLRWARYDLIGMSKFMLVMVFISAQFGSSLEFNFNFALCRITKKKRAYLMSAKSEVKKRVQLSA